MKKRDVITLLIALLLAGALFGARAYWLSGKRPERAVRITVDGKVYATEVLDEERDIVVEQDNGARNVITLYADGFRMRSSTCRNQLCVQQGDVNISNFADRALGAHVICLPNRVDVELLLSEEDDVSLSPDA